jgi:hypothetical protein
MLWNCPNLYPDTNNKGVWQIREADTLLAAEIRANGNMPDQVTRALNGTGGGDLGMAMCWGIQRTGYTKSNNTYAFTNGATYRLSCFAVERMGETTTPQTIQVWLDPNNLTDFTNAKLFGTIQQNQIQPLNWFNVSFTYVATATGNYYIRLLGTVTSSTTDRTLFVSNLEIVKV